MCLRAMIQKIPHLRVTEQGKKLNNSVIYIKQEMKESLKTNYSMVKVTKILDMAPLEGLHNFLNFQIIRHEI